MLHGSLIVNTRGLNWKAYEMYWYFDKFNINIFNKRFLENYVVLVYME